MSDDVTKDDFDLPLNEIVSTGAAIETAETDEALKKLPRLLRYAIMSNLGNGFAHERLVAEIVELVPDLPMAASWAINCGEDLGIELALTLDRLAVVNDQPDLRSLADCVRLLCLELPQHARYVLDHLRVSKALMHANWKLPKGVNVKLASEIEAFSSGWAMLPLTADLLPRFREDSAFRNALAVGQKMARRRIIETEAELKEKFEAHNQTLRDATRVQDAAKDPSFLNAPSREDGLVVCRLTEEARQNVKMREVIAPFKDVIDVALPLAVVPPLHNIRADLLFEFPYAQNVIDFALADLVGRRTIRLRPLLLVGPPGGGKSRFARRLGETLSLSVWRTDASRSDGAVFGGTDKRWYSAEPCHSFLAVAQAKQANPMVLIDELEKAGTRSDYGRLWDCLLGFLEPETASRYPDPALQVNLDLSHVTYVATANTLDALPSPLRDRFRVIEFPKPAQSDLDALLPAVITDLAAESGLDSRGIEPLSGSDRDLVAANWHGGSVRRLRRVVEIVLRARDQTAVRN